MKNPSSTQPLGTGQESKSCGCTSDVATGMNPVPEEFMRPAEQRTAEQPASGVTGGQGKLSDLHGDKS